MLEREILQRTQLQANVRHFEKKLAEQRAKVEKAEGFARTTEEEFRVRDVHFALSV